MIQVCDSKDVRIMNGVVSKDHVRMHIEYPPRLSLSVLIKKLKGRSSRLLPRVHRASEALLGEASVGNRLWSMKYGQCN
ncbi:MAG: hypothetical protein GXO75_10650 [Calditrichaeota bacterium]|nr:hypothetical protein [Calditrichota bacterium]